MTNTDCLSRKPDNVVKRSKEADNARGRKAEPIGRMDDAVATKLEAIYAERYGKWEVAKGRESRRLVAAFMVSKGHIESLHVFDSVKPFTLTERRKRLVQQHYSTADQMYIVLYMERDTESYHPVSMRDFAIWPNHEERRPRTPLQVLLELWRGPRNGPRI